MRCKLRYHSAELGLWQRDLDLWKSLKTEVERKLHLASVFPLAPQWLNSEGPPQTQECGLERSACSPPGPLPALPCPVLSYPETQAEPTEEGNEP